MRAAQFIEHYDELKDWYVYSTPEPFTVAALASISSNINFEAESDFYILKISGFADIAAAAQNYDTRVVPLITLEITDSGSNRNLVDAGTAWSNIVGWGEIPYILPLPRKMRGNSNLRINATSFDAVNAYNLRLSFSGIKDYGAVKRRS